MGYIRNLIGAGLTAIAMYGCGRSNPVQPVSSLPSSKYETLDSRLQETFHFNNSFEAFLAKPTTNQARSFQDVSLKPNVRDLYTATKIAAQESRILGIEDLGYEIGRFSVSINAPGYEPRETKVLADIRSTAVAIDDELVPVDAQVRTLYDEAARTTQTGGTSRWKNPPVIYISKSSELIRGAKVTDDLIKQITDLVPSAVISQFGAYAQNADIRIVDDAPWQKLDPNQPGKWPARPPEETIIVQYNNFIPGVGEAGLFDNDNDGYTQGGGSFF